MPAGHPSLLSALALVLLALAAGAPAGAQGAAPTGEAPASAFETWYGRAQGEQARGGCDPALPYYLNALAAPDAARSGHLDEARVALGACYVQERFWTLAKQVLQPVFAQGPSNPMHKAAGALLIETALGHGGRPEAEPLAMEMERIYGEGALPPPLLVKLGFAALKDRALPRARTLLTRVPVDAPEYARAQYLLGAVLISQGSLPEAAAAFQRATATATDPDLRGDARLALARVDFDLGRYPQAMSSYAAVRGEPRWSEAAQYEYAWTLEEAGRRPEARAALQELLRTAPRSTVLPDAQVMGAYLQLEAGEYQPAWDHFKSLLYQYQGVDDRMGMVLQEYADPLGFYRHAAAEASLPAQVSGPLPPQIFGWALDRPVVQDADRTLTYAKDAAHEIEEAQGMLADLMERARQYASHMTDDISDAIAHVQERLNAARARLILTRMTFRERNAYERLETMKRELQALERRDTQLSQEVANRRQLPGDQGMSAEAGREITARVSEEGVRIRRALDVALLSEDDLLDLVFRHLGLGRDPVGQRLANLFAQTRDLQAMLGKLASDFNAMVAIRSGEERQGLTALASAAQGLVQRCELTRGSAAQTAFQEVQRVTLVNALAQAQLGFVDASWKVKETETTRIDTLYQQEGHQVAQLTDRERAWRQEVGQVEEQAQRSVPPVERPSFEAQSVADLEIEARRLEIETSRLQDLVRRLSGGR